MLILRSQNWAVTKPQGRSPDSRKRGHPDLSRCPRFGWCLLGEREVLARLGEQLHFCKVGVASVLVEYPDLGVIGP